MQLKPLFPLVVLAVPLNHGGPRKWSWLCGIDGEHAPRLIAPRPIASHMSNRHGGRPQSSPGLKSRPGRPHATICPPAQTPVLFSTSLTQLLARRVLPATQNFLTPNPQRYCQHLRFLPPLTLLSRTNAQTHPSTTPSAPPSLPRNRIGIDHMLHVQKFQTSTGF